MPKATKAQKESRLNAIYTLLVNGATRYEIMQYATKHFGLKARQVDNYIASANAQIAAEAEYHRAREIGRAKVQLDTIYRQALAAHNYQAATSARRELNALFSLYAPAAPQTLKIEGLDPAELQVFVDALAARGKKASDIFAMMMEVIADHADRS